MLISVIVPIYNIEKHLKSCVDSLLKQTYTDFEIILVDDGSQDSCNEICDQYAAIDSRVRAVHKENGGVNSARLRGVEEATGSYVMFVDGDDWLNERCIETIAGILNIEEIQLLCFNSIYVYKYHEETVISPYTGYYDKEHIRRSIYPCLIEDKNGNHFDTSIWGKVYDKEMLLEVFKNIDTTITVGEDGAVVRPFVLNAESICFVEDCLYFYNRTNETSVTRVLKPIQWENTRKIRNEYLRLFGDGEEWIYQINRNTVHNLMVTVKSRLHTKDSFISNIIDIHVHLREYRLEGVFDNTFYTGTKARVMNWLLKNSFIIILYLYNLISDKKK